MKLCNLFLYKVKNVPYNEICDKYRNFEDGIIESLDIECTDKLYFYEVKSDCQFVPLDEEHLSDESTIVAVDMHSLGISNLNEDSFGDNMDTIEEKYEALSLLSSFHRKILSEKNLRGNLAIDCRNNRSIEKHLDTSYLSTSDYQILDSLSDLKDKPFSSQCDHLISVSKYFNVQTCSVLSKEISLHSWIEILDGGSNVRRTVEVPRSSPVEISISADVFDHCLTWDSCSRQQTDLSLLGQGGFAKTFKYDIESRSNSIVSVVIKQNKPRDKREDEKPAWYREACHTRRICHENIIKYFGKPILYKNHYYCVMEYGGISLSAKYVKKSTMNLSDICVAMLHIAEAINYLHNHMDNVIIHRDIRSSNVTVTERNVYKLIDFGISSEKCEEQSAFDSDIQFGNVLWKSPEYCKYLLEHKDFRGDILGPGRKSDIWMFGIFVMEMLCFPGYPQFFWDYKDYKLAFLRDVANKNIDLVNYLEDCDDTIRTVVTHCLKYSEDERVDSKQLLEHCQNL